MPDCSGATLTELSSGGGGGVEGQTRQESLALVLTVMLGPNPEPG